MSKEISVRGQFAMPILAAVAQALMASGQPWNLGDTVKMAFELADLAAAEERNGDSYEAQEHKRTKRLERLEANHEHTSIALQQIRKQLTQRSTDKESPVYTNDFADVAIKRIDKLLERISQKDPAELDTLNDGPADTQL